MKLKVLFISIAPPENHCGVRVVMYRHIIEHDPFELLVATNADYFLKPQPHIYLKLPYLLHRLQKSRLGPVLRPLLLDFQNLIWPLLPNLTLDNAILSFQPDVLLVLADNSLGEIAIRAAKKHKIPLAALFLDWFPVMDGYYGHPWSRKLLSDRFHKLYKTCNLAFCTSDGMQEILGEHPNSHVIYPMPGQHKTPTKYFPPSTGKFRLVYVGSVQNFYGRMMCALIKQFELESNLEMIIVGPNADWPEPILKQAKMNGSYLGFKPPEEAAEVLAGADALLVVMSFEKKYELFMRTSFTTKFLDYVNFSKPIILWGPDYCTPSKLATKFGGAIVVNTPNPEEVVSVCQQIKSDRDLQNNLVCQAEKLHKTLFNPERLQQAFVSQINNLVS